MGSANKEKFILLAEKRVKKTIKDIRLIGNLSNRRNYSYTQEDVNHILKTLEYEIKELKSRFSNSGSVSDIKFTLKKDS